MPSRPRFRPCRPGACPVSAHPPGAFGRWMARTSMPTAGGQPLQDAGQLAAWFPVRAVDHLARAMRSAAGTDSGSSSHPPAGLPQQQSINLVALQCGRSRRPVSWAVPVQAPQGQCGSVLSSWAAAASASAFQNSSPPRCCRHRFRRCRWSGQATQTGLGHQPSRRHDVAAAAIHLSGYGAGRIVSAHPPRPRGGSRRRNSRRPLTCRK